MPGHPVPRAGNPNPGRVGLFRFSAALYLVALLFLFVATPFLDQIQNGDLLEALLLTLVLGTGLLAVGSRRRTLIFGLALVVPALIGQWAHHFRPQLVHPAVFLPLGGVFIVFVVLQLLRFILRARKVSGEVLCAGIAGYLTLGLLWTLTYLFIARINPGAFALPSGAQLDRFTALYFSFITLTTTGYGDISPVTNVARMLAMMEAITGTFYLAILISRLVALYSSSGGSRQDEDLPSVPIL